MSLCGVVCSKHSWDFVCMCTHIWPCVCVHAMCICVWPCVYVYAVVFDWYLICMSVRSSVLGVGVVKHVLRLLDGRCVWCRCY